MGRTDVSRGAFGRSARLELSLSRNLAHVAEESSRRKGEEARVSVWEESVIAMICEVCRENEATVHLTEIVSNTKKEVHLCEGCAQEKGVAIHSHVKQLSIPQFFDQVLEPKPVESRTDPECSSCGVQYSQFRASGKLGCPHCFEEFRPELDRLLEKIHSGATQHRGKVPSHVSRIQDVEKELHDLRSELDLAVDREEYEHAAELRDRIHDLERGEHCS